MVSFLEGKTRVFQRNPRYVFIREIQELSLKACSFLPADIQEKHYKPIQRKRPRKTGKPI